MRLPNLYAILGTILVIGILIYFGLLYITSQNISVKVKEISDLKYKITTNKVELIIKLEINNTGPLDVVIEKVYYEVYINGEYLGNGTKSNIVISVGRNYIELPLEISAPKTIKTLLKSLLLEGKATITVKGYVDIPIKSFGIIKLWTLELTFKKTVEVKIVEA